MLNRFSYFARAVIFFALLLGGQACAAGSMLLGWPMAVTVILGFASALASGCVYGSTAYAGKNTIDAITRDAKRMSEGDLAFDVHVFGSDATVDGLRSLKALQNKMRETIGAVRLGSNEVSTASNEIATGNQDLSQRTEQTASDLQQTASSLSQLTVNVRQSADAAAQANQLASSATQVARRGGEVVSQVVATMEEINSSSKKIADIIGTIDGIAFQTNILALNAAVEAARAGEQGRGFAVVAGEVRSLAQRSAEAAKEIKSLIGTSVDKVETGSKLVEDAGTTMNDIVTSVQRVTDIIGEISAAALEQSQGIGQVNEAVTRLDQMTQQNAALVEESAAAAESLKDQAQRMTTVVANYRLAGAALSSHIPTLPVATPPAAHVPAAAKAIAKAAAPRPTPTPTPTPVPKPAAAARPAVTKTAAATTTATPPAPAAAPGASDEWESF